MTRCEFCRGPVQWLRCRDGKRRLFDLAPVDVHEATGPGWVAARMPLGGSKRNQVVMAPIAHVSRVRAEQARRVVLQHRCAEYRVTCEAAGIVLPQHR